MKIMEKTVKFTKKDKLALLDAIVSDFEATGGELDSEITFEDLKAFIAREVELLDNKAAAAQKRAAEKKAEGDELRERVLNVLDTENFMAVDDIVAALGDPEVTRNMVISRLTQLGEKNGTNQVEKGEITIPAASEGGKARKTAAYRRKA